MHRQAGDLQVDSRGLAHRDLLVRHLVMPKGLAGTKEAMEFLAKEISLNTFENIMGKHYPHHQAKQDRDIKPGIGRKLLSL